VGKIEKIGSEVRGFKIGDRVGVPWLGYTCGKCSYCLNEQENLCDNAQFTGYTLDGGYAEYSVANAKYSFHLPDKYNAESLAPLLCAGLIGWRSYKMAGSFNRIGFYGFGVAAHILTQIAISQGKEVYAFTRNGDTKGQTSAKELGAIWAGGSSEKPHVELDAAIIFAPIGDLVLGALKIVRKSGAIVCGGIHMSDIPAIPYQYLWGERIIRSVANLTRADATEFFEVSKSIDLKMRTQSYSLTQANEALSDFKSGTSSGAAVLMMNLK
jgi:propanol-preferring alcohol dehydrogenase